MFDVETERRAQSPHLIELGHFTDEETDATGLNSVTQFIAAETRGCKHVVKSSGMGYFS